MGYLRKRRSSSIKEFFSDIEDNVFWLVVFISFFIIVLSYMTFAIIITEHNSDKRTNNNAGYYCKYCHRGVGINGDSVYNSWRNYRLKEVAKKRIQYEKCSYSKDGYHKLKWYNEIPPKKGISNKRVYLK